MGEKSFDVNWLAIGALVVGSPVLLVVLLVTGVFTLASMISIVTNPYVLGSVILLNGLFYGLDRLGTASVMFSGIFVGAAFWIVGLIGLFTGPLGVICGIPILGGLVCGSITLASIFTSLIGYIAAGLLISAFVGAFLMLIR